jgi:mono/diheme cytochrome c family protein
MHAVAVTDVLQHHTMLVTLDPTQGWRVAAQWPVPHSPVAIVASRDGRTVAVASLWARQITICDVPALGASGEAGANVLRRQLVDLPFAPRSLWLDEPSNSLLVGDAFSNRLAVVDITTGTLKNVWRLPGSHVRAISYSPDQDKFLFLVKYAAEFLPVERDHVFWGNIFSHVVVGVDRAQLFSLPRDRATAETTHASQEQAVGTSHEALQTEDRRVGRWSVWPLSTVRQGSADAESLQLLGGSSWVVALGGVGEVLLHEPAAQSSRRCSVGQRPTALLVDPSGQWILVANTFSHSISVVERSSWREQRQIVLCKAQRFTVLEEGERLFYDARLSLDGWMSCHSCHTDGHMLALKFDNLGDGDYGAPKRVPSLLGLAGTQPFGWDGSKPDLLSQLRRSLATTMHGDVTSLQEEKVRALAAYIESLPPPPGLAVARGQIDAAAVERGKRLFAVQGCDRCHPPPLYTDRQRHDVHLSDERGRRHFNPPSLLGVSQRDAWLHDGRARSLREIFSHHHHPQPFSWTQQQLDDLIAWLSTL